MPAIAEDHRRTPGDRYHRHPPGEGTASTRRAHRRLAPTGRSPLRLGLDRVGTWHHDRSLRPNAPCRGCVPRPGGEDWHAGRRGRGGEALHLAALESMRSEEHTSELQSLMRISYAVFCLKKKKYTH